MRVEEIHDQLIAFYPAYTDQGSMTRLLYAGNGLDGEAEGFDPRQVESVRRALAGCYAVDLRAQARLLRSRYYRKLPLHFYLPDGRVFAAFKLRDPLVPGDACYGYVNLDRIKRLVPGDAPHLLLYSGTRLPLCSSIRTARLAYLFALEVKLDLICLPEYERPELVPAVESSRQGMLTSQPQAPLKKHRYWINYSHPK